jgi:hypothetical protein
MCHVLCFPLNLGCWVYVGVVCQDQWDEMASFETRPGECSNDCQNAVQSTLLRHAQEVPRCPFVCSSLGRASCIMHCLCQVVEVTLAHLANTPAKARGGLVVGGWSGGGMVGAKAAELFLQRGVQVHLVVFISAVPDSNQVSAFCFSFFCERWERLCFCSCRCRFLAGIGTTPPTDIGQVRGEI